MPELSCTVQTCVHNYQYLCELDSFEERREGSYSNKTDSMKSVSDCSDVDCQAKDCRYNEECKCHAGKISVEGGDACHSSGTECATFDCCCN